MNTLLTFLKKLTVISILSALLFTTIGSDSYPIDENSLVSVCSDRDGEKPNSN